MSTPISAPVEVQEAAHHEAGACQQHERQRELPDDQGAGPAPRAHAAGTGPSALLQHVVDVGLRNVQRRRQAEQDAGAERHGGEKSENGEIHREVNPRWLADVLGGGVEQAHADQR